MSIENAPEILPWQNSLLQRAVDLKQGNHLSHAVMIETSSSQDISSFVRYLAMRLLCDNPEGLSFCGHCDACRMMLGHTYSDYFYVTLEVNEKTNKTNKNIKIEQVRKLIHEVSLTRHYERLKIAIIYPAESMSTAGANALLKTLEEPADEVLLLLVTHNKGRIPVTIRSRCQIWSLGSASEEEALAWLEKQGLEQEKARRYLEFAKGDPVLALHLRQMDYASLVDQFKTRFSSFIRGDLDVTNLCKDLRSFDTDMIRRLVDRILSAYCFQMSETPEKKPVLQSMLELQLQAQQNLSIEENNLDLQIQLEDVLISLKQILTRRSV